MKKYQVYIDVAEDENFEDIVVESTTVEALNPDDAYMEAVKEAQEDYEYFYVWEVTEDDEI